VAEAARSLGIGEDLLRCWKLALEKQGEQAFPGHGNRPALEEGIRPASRRHVGAQSSPRHCAAQGRRPHSAQRGSTCVQYQRRNE
jgi:hypothetical protein